MCTVQVDSMLWMELPGYQRQSACLRCLQTNWADEASSEEPELLPGMAAIGRGRPGDVRCGILSTYMEGMKNPWIIQVRRMS